MADFVELDTTCVNTIRCLSIDMVQKANSGHPGMPLGMAPLAHVLFSRFLRFSSKNHKWFNRDRFVLSNGHGCALLYSMLHLSGYDLTLQDLQNFRQLDSKTPGHPECFITAGVEVTTGPLGQGLTNAVGIAMASKHSAARFSKPGFEQLFENKVYVFCGDGCLMEGITSEAASLAGHLGLGNLVVIYDDNKITIDGNTGITFTEEVAKRFESYGWAIHYVKNADSDLAEIQQAIAATGSVQDKPHLILARTTIGFGSKNQGSDKVHGAPLGEEEVGNVKAKFGFAKDAKFNVPAQVYEFYHKVSEKGRALEDAWNKLFESYAAQFPELAAHVQAMASGKVVPDNVLDFIPKWTPKDAAAGTRKMSQKVLNAIADNIPELIGGSADLAGSNLTDIAKSHAFQKGSYDGRILRFGVREHAMAAICNGIATCGYIPFCATFLNFMGYMFGAARLSALSHHQVIYVMTHDSIGLGEDGPTHQPVEVLAMLRATPNFTVMRPADGNEVSGAYLQAIKNNRGPTCISLTRQDVPNLEHSSIEKVAFGAYPIYNIDKKADLIIVATGSEVIISIDAAKKLEEKGIVARIVSMPSMELFAKQSIEYKESVLVPGVPIISVEAATTFGWDRYSHVQLGIDTFGKSGPFKKIYEAFGLTPDTIATKGAKVVEFYKQNPQQLYNVLKRVQF